MFWSVDFSRIIRSHDGRCTFLLQFVSPVEDCGMEIKMKHRKIDRKTFEISLVLLVFASVYIFVCSSSTSLLYGLPAQGDSVIFQTIGKYWLDGMLPYVDMFDHKGPALYFINAIGYWLGGGTRFGIVILQIMALTITEYFIYKIYRREFDKRYSLLLTIVTVIALSVGYNGGNLTEEWALPFITASFYCIFRWGEQMQLGQYEHNYNWAFLYGVTFSFCFLTRINNAVAICIGVVFIAIILIVHKKWNNLLRNILAFLSGFAVVSIPFFLYFAANGALYEMWYGMIVYNLDYAKEGGIHFDQQMFLDIIRLLCIFFNSYSLLFVGIWMIFLNKGRRITGILWVLVAIITSGMFIFSDAFAHYSMIALPYFCVSIIELHKIRKICTTKSVIWKLNNAILLCFLAVGFFAGSIAVAKLPLFHSGGAQKAEKGIDILQLIPEEEKESFIAWNCPMGLYLEENLHPYYKYFFLQDWLGSRSESLNAEIHDVFFEGDVKWILISETEGVTIEDVLDLKYECVAEQTDTGYKLYTLKN